MTRFTRLVVLEGLLVSPVACRTGNARRDVNFRELRSMRYAASSSRYYSRNINRKSWRRARSSSSTTHYRTLSATASRHCAVCDFYRKSSGIPCRIPKTKYSSHGFFFNSCNFLLRNIFLGNDFLRVIETSKLLFQFYKFTIKHFRFVIYHTWY